MLRTILERCQPWLYTKAECRLCADACPVEGCISFKGNTVTVKTEDCAGCGICVAACPTGALVMDSLTDEELFKRLCAAVAGCDKDTTIRCSLGPNTNNFAPATDPNRLLISIPCLAMLKEPHLASIIWSGIPALSLDTSRCKECRFRTGKNAINKSVSYANNLLNAMGYKDCIKTEDAGKMTASADLRHNHKPNQTKKTFFRFKDKKTNMKTISPGPEYSRRELLNLFREKAVEKAVERVAGKTRSKKTGLAGANVISDRRQLLLNVLKEKTGLNGLQPNLIEDGKFPARQIRIGKDCTLCHACELFCPTGAIARVERKADSDDAPGEISIDFHAALCAACYQCAELCPEHAMGIEKSIDLAAFAGDEIKTLFKKTIRECPSCNGYFYPEDGAKECIVCAKKNSIDQKVFGAFFNNDAITRENKLTQ